jgi:LysM repeat protein
MRGIVGVLNDLYIRFLVWLGAEPPPGHEHLIGREAGPREHIVKAGDTLFSVARKFNVHYERIALANGIEPAAALQPGQKLLIPPASWEPASGPLAQVPSAPAAPAPTVAPITESPVEPQVAPQPVAPPPEEVEPFVEAQPQVIPPEGVMPALTAEPVVEKEEQLPELPEWLRPPAEEAEAAAPSEPPEPLETAAATPAVPPVEVEPIPVITEAALPIYAPEQAEVFRYEVQQGDTFNAIARRYGVTVSQLLEANNLTESDRIFVGQKLIIPSYIPPTPPAAPLAEPQPAPQPVSVSPDQFFVYTMTRGDTLNSIANRYGVNVHDLIEINQIEYPDQIKIGQQLRIPMGGIVALRAEPGAELKPSLPAFVAVDPSFPLLGPAQAVRALYVSYFAIGHPETRQRIFDLLDATELNAIVLDVKGDDGWITYPTQVPLAREIGADRPMVKEFQVMMEQFKTRGLYTIGRVVAFKDGLLAKNYPEYAVKMSGAAETSADREYLTWTDPFLKPVWDYNVQVAIEAAQMGFDEMQFSHLRFPTPSQAGTLEFSQEASKETRIAAVTGFLSIARGQLQPYNVRISADVLGYTCWRKDDTLIGQDIERMGQYLDVLCPMLYPSTFGSGIPGYKMAIAHPYEVVYESAQRAVSRVAPLGCEVRPWIQDFPDYRFDKRVYGRQEIQSQIKACFDAGCTGFMVWDHRVKYSDGAYAPVKVVL